MATQHGDMAAWYKAVQDRDTIIGQVRQENVLLRRRLDEYIAALNERDEVIRDLRIQMRRLANILEQEPPAMAEQAASDEGPVAIPGEPSPAPMEGEGQPETELPF